jgi:hypothetical protein
VQQVPVQQVPVHMSCHRAKPDPRRIKLTVSSEVLGRAGAPWMRARLTVGIEQWALNETLSRAPPEPLSHA